MDDTLIKVKSGAKWPKGPTDWAFWDESVPAEIVAYHKKGYRIVIFTNQNGITTGNTTEDTIKTKI